MFFSIVHLLSIAGSPCCDPRAPGFHYRASLGSPSPVYGYVLVWYVLSYPAVAWLVCVGFMYTCRTQLSVEYNYVGIFFVIIFLLVT